VWDTMHRSIDRVETVRNFVKQAFSDDLHAKRVLSLADAALGVVTSASLAVSMIGHALAQARGLIDKHAIKQVDRLLSNQGVQAWDLFAPWVRHMRETARRSSWRWTGPISTPTGRRHWRCIWSPATDAPRRSSG